MLDTLVIHPLILTGDLSLSACVGMMREFKPGLTLAGRGKTGTHQNFYPKEQLDIPSSKYLCQQIY